MIRRALPTHAQAAPCGEYAAQRQENPLTRSARGATSNRMRSLALVEGDVTLVNTPFSFTMICASQFSTFQHQVAQSSPHGCIDLLLGLRQCQGKGTSSASICIHAVPVQYNKDVSVQQQTELA